MADQFRRAQAPRHVRIYGNLTSSIAWKHLSGSAVKLLLALADLERGENNGEFFLSVRDAAKRTGLSKDTAGRCFRELMEKGFIYCSERGSFSRKVRHAACWGLTWVPGPSGTPHRSPTHAYQKWRPENRRS